MSPHLIDRYHYTVGWDTEHDTYIATCREFPELLAESDTTENALAVLKAKVLDAVLEMLERHKTPPDPV